MPHQSADLSGDERNVAHREELTRLADEEKKLKRRAAEQKRREKQKRLAETITDRRVFSVPVFAARNGISLRQAWYELSSRRLVGRRSGRRTLITEDAERAWQRKLPKVVPSNTEATNRQGRSSRSPAERLRPAQASRRAVDLRRSRKRSSASAAE